MNTPLHRSVSRSAWFWLLLILSLAAAAVGGWLISGQVSTMTATLLDGTATGVEVYVGQSLIVVGASVLGAGVLGILIAVALLAAQALVPMPVPSVVTPPTSEEPETVDEGALVREPVAVDEGAAVKPSAEKPSAVDAADGDDQNGSSGSTATATKINVK